MSTVLYFCITDLSPNPPNVLLKSTQQGKEHPEVLEGVPPLRWEPGVSGDLELSSSKQPGESDSPEPAGPGRTRGTGRQRMAAGGKEERKERRKGRRKEGRRGSGRGREGPGRAEPGRAMLAFTTTPRPPPPRSAAPPPPGPAIFRGAAAGRG